MTTAPIQVQPGRGDTVPARGRSRRRNWSFDNVSFLLVFLGVR